MNQASGPRKLSVLQIITHLELGGAEEVAISLAEALHEEVDFTFFIVQGGDRSEIGRDFYLRLQALRIPVYLGTVVPMKMGGAMVSGFKLNRLIRRLRPDIVHLHTEIPETTFACATLFGLPDQLEVVRTIHNTSLWPAWAQIGAWAERRLAGARVAAVSRGGLDGLKRFQDAYGLPRTDETRAQIIYAGVSKDTGPRPTPPAANASGPVRVLFAGRLELQKGVDLMPAIVERASRLTVRPVAFHIAGSGTYAPQLREWAERQHTGWDVTVGPPIPNLAGYLHEGRHDLVFMPSRFEGLSLVAVESLLAGVPLVTTRIDGLKEIFQSDYPLLAEPEDVDGLADVLAQAINDGDAALHAAQVHRASVMDRFSQTGMGRHYLQLYRRAVVNPAT
ncbi:glycosyltransferase involved in cell wall biosynthesis [Deinococcus metalli]|uniref:Glycosyltransferase involved in cell wall biosynthesis n=1 Tax=Deinococcus metalli TaxID=1141878 RepID=A0A7W8NPM5_9DEIO|nr:glycosyltransferase family 4 protein [Deinococcus metalli]MBB5375935.1 glycosyltransferase involved in cell wall biosynthesis [Deinococcus metalli]